VTVGNFNLRQLQEIVRLQRDTIRRFYLDSDASLRAGAYAQRLYEQFGLSNGNHPRYETLVEAALLSYGPERLA
jgi:hypothetical protein